MSQDLVQERHDQLLTYCFYYNLPNEAYRLMRREIMLNRQIVAVNIGEEQVMLLSYTLKNDSDIPTFHLITQLQYDKPILNEYSEEETDDW